MTLRDWIREELRPAAGTDELGDIILEEAVKLLGVSNDMLDVQIDDGAEEMLRHRYGDDMERIRGHVRRVRKGARGKDAPAEQIARQVLREQWRELIAEEHTNQR